MRESGRVRQAWETHQVNKERRTAWIGAHPLSGSVLLGSALGLFAAVYFTVRHPQWSFVEGAVVPFAAGLLLLGPFLAISVRLQERSRNRQ